MIRKLILFIALSFCLVFSASAWNPMVVTGGSGAESSPCPSYYASAILSWDGDHSSGVLNACDSSGDAVLFTDNGSVDISTYGESSSNAIRVDATSDYMKLTQTSDQYVDGDLNQTLCMKVNTSAQTDTTVRLFQFSLSDYSDYIAINQVNDDTIIITYNAETTSHTSTGAPLQYAAWYYHGYSWEGTDQTTGDLSANPGDQATWADGWETDAAIADGPAAAGIIYLWVGKVGNSPGATQTIDIDEWALVSGNMVDCKALME